MVQAKGRTAESTAYIIFRVSRTDGSDGEYSICLPADVFRVHLYKTVGLMVYLRILVYLVIYDSGSVPD